MSAARPIGALRHRLTVERASLAADGATVWTVDGVLFAALTPVSASETDAGGGSTGRITHRVETRFRDDLTSRDRLALGDRIFRILASRDLDERRSRLVLDVQEERR